MNLKTLIIDDDPIFVMMLKKLLAGESYYSEPKSFGNGQEAMYFFKPNYDPATDYVIF